MRPALPSPPALAAQRLVNHGLAAQRLVNQCIAPPRHRRATDVVQWLGAVQAQEYEPAKWALALRMREGVEADVERALEQGHILRTHVMRPTWHFVSAADIRWLQMLTAPRVQRVVAPQNRRLELDAATLRRVTLVFERSLRDRQYLMRAELSERLGRAGLAISGQRLAHAAMHAELEGVICSGPRRGKQQTYALVAERAPAARELSRDEALEELTRRYFRSHGPATVRDFVWWSGLTTADARRGLQMVGATSHEVDGYSYWTTPPGRARDYPGDLVHLLPIYDEYVVAYRDRILVPHGPPEIASSAGHTVTFRHSLVSAGAIVGTWEVARSSRSHTISVTPLRPLTQQERRGVLEAAARYERFAGVPVATSIA